MKLEENFRLASDSKPLVINATLNDIRKIFNEETSSGRVVNLMSVEEYTRRIEEIEAMQRGIRGEYINPEDLMINRRENEL